MDKLPAYFASPNPELFQCLREQMRSLPIVTLKAVQKELMRFFDLNQLSILNENDTIGHLRSELLRDYQKQVNEIDDVPWTFDYVIEDFRPNSKLVAAQVCTRFVSPDPDKGNILYGTEIYRVGNDKFTFPTQHG
ncbi:MAG: hypothetical protein Q8L53_04965 [Aestuariivirga sp.]|nr:hypothetical protein [Aestuariivirga sp.]